MASPFRRCRREFLALAGSLLTTGVAGCTGNDDEETPSPTLEDTSTPTPSPTPTPGDDPTQSVEEVWSTSLEETVGNGHQAPPPTLTDELLLIGTGLNREGKIHALDPINGESEWIFDVRDSMIGYNEISVSGEYIFIRNHNDLRAVELESGSLAWSEEIVGLDTVPVTADNLVIVTTTDTVEARYPADGEPVWETAIDGFKTEPISIDGSIYVGAESKAYKIDLETGDVDWRTTIGSIGDTPAGIVDGNVFFATDDKFLHAIDASDGEKSWSVVFDNDIVFQPVGEENTVFAAGWSLPYRALSVEDGADLWEWSPRYQVSSTATVVDNVFYAGSDTGSVYGLDAKSGEILWSFDSEGTIWSKITVSESNIYVVTGNGNVHRLKTNK